jgi:hypothetical protein
LEEESVVFVLTGVLSGFEVGGQKTHGDQGFFIFNFSETSFFIDLKVLLILLLKLINDLLPLALSTEFLARKLNGQNPGSPGAA